MLRSLQVTRFKSIHDATLDFGRVNLFIGGNGSGKSNILEAIGILSSCLSDLSEVELMKRGVRLSLPTLFKSAFRAHRLDPKLDLVATFDEDVAYRASIKAGDSSQNLRFFSESAKVGRKTFLARTPKDVTIGKHNVPKGHFDPTQGLWGGSKNVRILENFPDCLGAELDRMARYAIYAPQTAFLRGTENPTLPIKPLGLHGDGLPAAIDHLLTLRRKWEREAPDRFDLFNEILNIVWLPGWTSALWVGPHNRRFVPASVLTGKSTLYLVDKFMRDGRNRLSAHDSSEGTLYLLFIVALLLHPDAPKIFAIDNVDNALNPNITREMLRAIITAACDGRFTQAGMGPQQVFLTSHNPTSLDAFDLFDDNQRVFVVQRDQKGATTVERLTIPAGWDREDWVKAAGGKSLSELWIENLIPGALGL